MFTTIKQPRMWEKTVRAYELHILRRWLPIRQINPNTESKFKKIKKTKP